MGIDSYPVFGRFVMWIAYTVILFLQDFDAFWLAFKCNHTEVVAIKEGKHVTMNVEDQYSAGRFESGERKFFLHVIAQRQAKHTIVFYIHIFRVSPSLVFSKEGMIFTLAKVVKI